MSPFLGHDGKWLRQMLGVALAVALMLGGSVGSALAGDDDDNDTADTKFVKGFLRTLGLQQGDESGIDYHERSPLVVPPTRDLPPPQSEAASAPNDADWPRDPDIARQKQAKKKKQVTAVMSEQEDMRPLRPDELKNGRDGQRAPATELPTPTGARPEQLPPSQLGFGGFSVDSVFNRNGKVVQFTGEPPRTNLTEPPPGLRTPSTKYPYGSKGTLEPTKQTGEDRAVFGVDK